MGLRRDLAILVLAGAAAMLPSAAGADLIDIPAQRVEEFQPDSSGRSINYVSPDGQVMLLQGGGVFSTEKDSSGKWGPRDASGNVILKNEGIGAGGASLSPDKQYMYYADGNIGEFRARRTESGWVGEGMVPNLIMHPESNYFNGTDIYMSQSGGTIWRAEYNPADNSFGESSLVSEINLEGYATQCAWVSADNRLMTFTSNRPGGYGGFDIWSASRDSRNDLWGNITNLGPNVNTAEYEGGAFITEFEDKPMLYFERGGYPGGDRWIMQAEVSQNFNSAGTPEPTTLSLLALGGLGGIGIFSCKRRRDKQR